MLERRNVPGLPGHRIVGVLTQVRRFFRGETIGHGKGHERQVQAKTNALLRNVWYSLFPDRFYVHRKTVLGQNGFALLLAYATALVTALDREGFGVASGFTPCSGQN